MGTMKKTVNGTISAHSYEELDKQGNPCIGLAVGIYGKPTVLTLGSEAGKLVIDINVDQVEQQGIEIIHVDSEWNKKEELKQEISKMLTLSTAHLDEDAVRKLEDEAHAKETGDELAFADITVYEKIDYGFFVYILEGNHEDLPECLQQCIKVASDSGCSLICFDRDADTINELPTYEW